MDAIIHGVRERCPGITFPQFGMCADMCRVTAMLLAVLWSLGAIALVFLGCYQVPQDRCPEFEAP